MGRVRILNSREKKHIMQVIKEQFGFEKPLDYVFLMNKKNKLYLVSQAIDQIDLDALKIDAMGLYVGELYGEQMRLSIEGAQLIGPGATKGLVSLDDDQTREWLKKIDIPFEESPGDTFVIVQHNDDFLGCGKWREGTLYNYLSKSRALKVVND